MTSTLANAFTASPDISLAGLESLPLVISYARE